LLRQRSVGARTFAYISGPSTTTHGRFKCHEGVGLLSDCAACICFHEPNKEAWNVLTNFPVFHAEYWVYALAGLVVIVVGTLLYTVDAPIKFSSWF
jgi:hypothetical protein